MNISATSAAAPTFIRSKLMPQESPFDREEYVHDDSEVSQPQCQLMMALVALTEYNAKLIRIAAEMHDFAPDGALELLRFHSSLGYDYSKLYEKTVDAMQVYAASRKSEEE